MAARGLLNFSREAQQSLEEVAYAIAEGKISDTLPCGPDCVHMNLTTLEGERYCVRLSMRGFEVVGRNYNSLELDGCGDLETYETVYALLDHLSPGYQRSFQHALADKLEQMEQTPNPTHTSTTSEVDTTASEVE